MKLEDSKMKMIIAILSFYANHKNPSFFKEKFLTRENFSGRNFSVPTDPTDPTETTVLQNNNKYRLLRYARNDRKVVFRDNDT